MSFKLKLGTLGISLVLDDRDFHRGMMKARKAVGMGLKAIGTGAAAMGAAAAAGIGASIKKFADLEHAVLGAAAVSSKGAGAFEDFMGAAFEASATTEFSARQAADALKFLSMAGFETSEAMKALPGVLNLTTAGGIELGEAADITSDILTGMGMEVDELSRVNDVLVKTFTSSNTTLRGLGDTLKYVGPVASSFGQDIETVATLAGSLGDAGLKGSLGGTALRQMFVRLVRPLRTTKEAMKELGVSLSDSDGEFRDFIDVIEDLEKAQARMTKADFGAKVSRLFGAEALPGVMALLKKGSQDLRQFRHDLDQAGGTAEEVAETMRSSLSSQVTMLKGNVENLSSRVGQVLAPAVKVLNAAFLDQVKALNEDEEAFEGLRDGAVSFLRAGSPMIEFMGKLAGIAAVIGGAFMEVVNIINILVKTIEDMASRAGYLFGAMAMAIEGDVKGATRVITTMNQMSEFDENAREIEGMIGDVGSFLDAGTEGFKTFSKAGENARAVVEDMASAIANTSGDRFSSLASAEALRKRQQNQRQKSNPGASMEGEGAGGGEPSKMVSAGKGLGDAAGKLFGDLADAAAVENEKLMEARAKAVEETEKEITEAIIREAEERKAIEEAAAARRADIVRSTMSSLDGILTSAFRKAEPVARQIGDVFSPGGVLSQIAANLPSEETAGRGAAALTAGVDALSAAMAAPGDPMMKAAAGLSSLAQSAIGAILQTDKAQAMMASLGNVLASIVPEGLVEQMLEAVDPLLGILHLMAPAFEVLGDLLAPLANIVGRVLFLQFKKFGLGVLALMTAIMAVRQGILLAVRGVVKGIRSLVNKINEAFKRLPDIPTDGLDNVINSLSDTIDNGKDKIKDIANSFKDLATTSFDEAGEKARREQEEYRKNLEDVNSELRNAPAGFKRILDRARVRSQAAQETMDRDTQDLSTAGGYQKVDVENNFYGYSEEEVKALAKAIMDDVQKRKFKRIGSRFSNESQLQSPNPRYSFVRE